MKLELVDKPKVAPEVWRAYAVFIESFAKARAMMMEVVGRHLYNLAITERIVGYNYNYYYGNVKGHISIRLAYSIPYDDTRKQWLEFLSKEAIKFGSPKITESEYTEPQLVRMGYEIGSRAAVAFMRERERGRVRAEWTYDKDFLFHVFHGIASAMGLGYSGEVSVYTRMIDHFIAKLEYEAEGRTRKKPKESKGRRR